MEKIWLKNYEPGVPAHIDYPDVPLAKLLEDTTREYGNRVATRFILKYILGGRLAVQGTLRYAQLMDAVDRFATALAQIGVEKEERVALMLPNSPHFVIAFFAAAKLGATVVNTNPQYVSREIKHQLVDSGAETIVILNLFYPRLREVQAETPLKRVIVAYVDDLLPFPFNRLVRNQQKKDKDWAEAPPDSDIFLFKELLAQYPPNPPRVEISTEDVVLFQYTGGTTGVPKAAMLTHKNIIANVCQVNAWMGPHPMGAERVMGVIPFFHCYGMTVSMIFSVFCAGQMLITPDPRQTKLIMEIMQNERATLYPGVPTMYMAINNHPEVQAYNLHSVKACISGAAPLPMQVATRFEEITGGRLVEGYGLTEAAPVTHCNPLFGLRKEGSIGIPFPDVEAQILDDETRAPAAVGEVGELVLRGPQVMKGYWNKPEETARTLDAEGWLYTGDIARMDEDGYFYIVDRKKEMIIASGYKIVPREVEEVLFTHPQVAEAVVAGLPDPRRGETVKAYVVMKAGASVREEELIEFCRLHLAPYKVPRSVEFRDQLPKSMVGKFLRRILVEEEKAKMAAKTAEKPEEPPKQPA